jgi:hypothetical protein
MVTAPPPSEPFQILGLDGIAAIMGALYVLLAFLIGENRHHNSFLTLLRISRDGHDFHDKAAFPCPFILK